MENWRLILVIVIMFLSVVDLVMTVIYVHQYKKWQPDKPYNLIELNPLLVFLWNNLGLILGMIVGSIIILTLNFIIAKNTYWLIPVVIGIVILLNIINHFRNFGLLHNLIEQYPLGHLPEQVFGNVTGNN